MRASDLPQRSTQLSSILGQLSQNAATQVPTEIFLLWFSIVPDLDPPDHMFLGHPDTDPLVKGMDLNPSITKQNNKKKLDSYCFVTSFGLFIFEKLCKCYVPSKSNKQKNSFLNYFFFASWRSVTKIAGSESGTGSISQRHGFASGSGSTTKCHGSGILLFSTVALKGTLSLCRKQQISNLLPAFLWTPA